MKRIVWILSLVIILSFIVLPRAMYSKDFQYTFSILHNEYKATIYLDSPEGRENFFLTATYYKLARTLAFELESDRGQHGRIEADAPDDPMLYDVMCHSEIKESCQVINDTASLQNICESGFRRYFMDDQKRAALRQEYEDLKQADVNIPPIILSPKNNSTHVGPGKVEFEMRLGKLAITPCKKWTFTVVFDRWDPSQGSNGKWVSGPHSYTTFQGYENDPETTCLAKYSFSFMPGKYRVTARSKHQDGRQSRWSPYIEFSVTMERKMTAMKPGIYISSPKSGESFTQGDLLHVRWTSVGVDQKVKVGLVKGQTIIPFTPAGGIEDKGLWRGHIPMDVPPDTYRLGVATMDNSKRDFLENITIKKKLVAIKKIK
ncbi:MAG: hypothetical protein JXB23_06125 [Candidatus Aminicenantes bacterium]|nr:hypothetical protein [Candidatus Aminicenantes bacterium]